jgi:hypothetical protein
VFPQEYLGMLTELVGKVERVFVIGTPLSRVSNPEWRAAYKVLPATPELLLSLHC